MGEPMRSIHVVLCSALLVACSGYSQFYKPVADPKAVPSAELLKEGQEPEVLYTDNLQRDLLTLRSRRYVPVGYAAFNGARGQEWQITSQAKKVGATVVLVQAKYTGTQHSTTPLLLPNSQTTYHSGTIYGDAGYGSYTGASTTYGQTVVPITTYQDRFDQQAVFMVKSNRSYRIGVHLSRLTPELRKQYQRNTGAVIDFVIEDTPAYYANLLPGDILIEVNHQSFTSKDDLNQMVAAIPSGAINVIFTLLRNGERKTVTIHLAD